MHELERYQIILAMVQEQPVATVAELVEVTSTSEATIRRDIAALSLKKKLRRVRGGAEAIVASRHGSLAGRPFSINQTLNISLKQAIAREAVKLCTDDDDIIINGGTTTFQMVYLLTNRRMQVFTNSFPVAEHLLKHSKNDVKIAGGTIYREQNIILSPYDNDFSQNYFATKMFIGAHSVGALGLMEADPLIIQSELKLMSQAEELVVLADSTKFKKHSSMIICALERVHTLITDDRISDNHAAMLEAADINVIVAPVKADQNISTSSAG